MKSDQTDGKTGRNKSRKSSREKRKQLSLTNQWLEENYCVCDGVCIPRCVLYSHYIDFCHTHSLSPACAATFGKVIRQKFPNITTRRLGTRGHSKYHYYGICIKETSPYYQSLYSGAGLTRFSGSKFVNEGGFTRKYMLSSRIGTLLPDFFSPYHLSLPTGVNPSKLETFLVMYRTHCQYILDTIIAVHFLELPSLLLHFWQEIPEHMLPLLEQPIVVSLIKHCDTILYSTIVDVLLPSSMQEVSDSLLLDVQKLANSWQAWTSQSLAVLSLPIIRGKLEAARVFTDTLRRQATFLHLVQMVRPILYDSLMVNQIVLDVNSIQLVTSFENQQGQQSQQDGDFLGQLKEVLHRQATVEAFMEWLDASISQRVIKACNDNKKLFRMKAHTFLMSWSKFGEEFMQAANAERVASSTSLKLIKLLLDEYVMVVIESHIQEQTFQEQLCEMQQIINMGQHAGAKPPVQFSNFCCGSPISRHSQELDPACQSSLRKHGLNYQTFSNFGTSVSHQNSCKYAPYQEAWGSAYPINEITMAWQPPIPQDHQAYLNYGTKETMSYSCAQQPVHPDFKHQGYPFASTDEPTQHLPSIGHVLY
ncbi:DNA-binding protein RFX6-like [Watersipora subatra]|uniref:DNA-binding protein RFX6-like n=1 Tax=Watersipora subatra TaxID=2589382 RepID=UPI00355C7E06